MNWTSSLSCADETSKAIDEIVASLLDVASTFDLLCVFASPHHKTRFADISRVLSETFSDARIVGCTGDGIIAEGREVQNGPALSVVAATLPGVTIDPFRLDTPNPESDLEESIGTVGDLQGVLLLVDPFSCNTETLVRNLDDAAPEATTFGGLASGAFHPGANVLLLDQTTFRDGAIGVAFRGPLRVETIVAQGCRPVGNPMIVTRHDGNVIVELDGGRPADVVEALYRDLSPEEQRLVPQSLLMGIEMRERPDGKYRRGDFLVRNILSIDANSGAISVGQRLERHQVVQFHLRDAATSTEDLEMWLNQYATEHPTAPAGGFLFSCVGRGEGLFGIPDHDSKLFAQRIGMDVPLGGFFCSGEIGPVGGKTFLHGYTSTFALFRPTSPDHGAE